ncbi:MAG: hydantoinase B/oxoprolinase family protein [Candidatus Binatia bacterium]|jgi:N-methylhydantoinase B|nr:hydantoinase B/oxoprolinase family protein [Candidatus Binatia bacterium]
MKKNGSTPGHIHPVMYEMFLHRLWAIGEEGRMTLQRVTASPIVSQGGECMSSFYDSEGTMVLACSGHLRFAGATSDALKSLIEWYSQSPGFHDGDQFFFNDPYVAGSHTYDMMIIKPIFYRDKLIAWTATSTHTADTGGMLRGGATQIFHEGIRILGLKIVERGEFREDVFKTLTEQCRDPQYVGLDLKAMIAGNNVCEKRYLGLVEKFGLTFVEAAGQKTIHDSEEMARSKLRSLPNGRWISRVYMTALNKRKGKAEPQQVVCTMSKQGEELHLDFSGTSPQLDNDHNSTLPSTKAHVGVALTNTLFWDVPWSDGKYVPVKLSVPEGSLLNCHYPAACGFAPWVGGMLVAAVCENVGKMLFAAGRYDDINASSYSLWYQGGPGYIPAGTNRDGIKTAMGIYDIHGSGLGAAPLRDGVNTGGHMNIPSGGISDIERIESQYPFLYFSRNHSTDSSGYGRFRGGLGSFRMYLIYGSKDFSVDYKPYGGIPQGSFGLFGGHPCGSGGLRAIFTTSDEIMDRMKSGDYPTQVGEISSGGWGEIFLPEGVPERVSLPEMTLLTDYVPSGGGYGDPLDRKPEMVARDVRIGATAPQVAERIYGVIMNPQTLSIDLATTESRRKEIREIRLRESRPLSASATLDERDGAWETVLRIHEYLEIARNGSEHFIRCIRCETLFGHPKENYKKYSLRRVVNLDQVAVHPLPPGETYLGQYHEYICPGCGTLLQMDVFCPALGGEEDLWDLRLDVP